MIYPIPSRSAIALGKIGGKPTNPGLIFERFAPNWGDAPTKEQKSEWKKAGFKAAIQHKADGNLLAAYKTRWEMLARFVHAEPFPMKTDWRFVAGLGRKGPLEAGFTFHRYGFPILPGSSVKGIARAAALLVHGMKETATDFLAIFGRAPQPGEDQQDAHIGGAIFFDAVPAIPPRLELDVMNPHYQDYYSGKAKYPTDWQKPVPVFFITVAPGSELYFAVGWRGADNHVLRGKATQWLKDGLTQLGAGAKTSAGYGYFQNPVVD